MDSTQVIALFCLLLGTQSLPVPVAIREIKSKIKDVTGQGRRSCNLVEDLDNNLDFQSCKVDLPDLHSSKISIDSFFEVRNILICFGIFDVAYELCTVSSLNYSVPDYHSETFCTVEATNAFKHYNFTRHNENLKNWIQLLTSSFTDSATCNSACILGSNVSPFCGRIVAGLMQYSMTAPASSPELNGPPQNEKTSQSKDEPAPLPKDAKTSLEDRAPLEQTIKVSPQQNDKAPVSPDVDVQHVPDSPQIDLPLRKDVNSPSNANDDPSKTISDPSHNAVNKEEVKSPQLEDNIPEPIPNPDQKDVKQNIARDEEDPGKPPPLEDEGQGKLDPQEDDEGNQGFNNDLDSPIENLSDPQLKEEPKLDDIQNKEIKNSAVLPQDNTLVLASVDDSDSSNMTTYFILMIGGAFLFYFVFHNKNKLLALALEGRKTNRRGGGRSSSAAYSKLHSNLEETIACGPASSSATHVLY